MRIPIFKFYKLKFFQFYSIYILLIYFKITITAEYLLDLQSLFSDDAKSVAVIAKIYLLSIKKVNTDRIKF